MGVGTVHSDGKRGRGLGLGILKLFECGALFEGFFARGFHFFESKRGAGEWELGLKRGELFPAPCVAGDFSSRKSNEIEGFCSGRLEGEKIFDLCQGVEVGEFGDD